MYHELHILFNELIPLNYPTYSPRIPLYMWNTTPYRPDTVPFAAPPFNLTALYPVASLKLMCSEALSDVLGTSCVYPSLMTGQTIEHSCLRQFFP